MQNHHVIQRQGSQQRPWQKRAIQSPLTMVVCLGVLMFFILSFWGLPAYGEQCIIKDGHRFCLVSVKRSAKYYWEYRAVLRVDGKRMPANVFDCRGPLAAMQGSRLFVCSLVPRR